MVTQLPLDKERAALASNVTQQESLTIEVVTLSVIVLIISPISECAKLVIPTKLGKMVLRSTIQ